MEYLTNTITLPASGFTAIIREANAFSEQLLFEATGDTLSALFDFWVSLIVELNGKSPVDKDDFLKLAEPDRVAIGLTIYKLISADGSLTLTTRCEYCGDPANFKIKIDELDYVPLPEGAVQPDPTFSIVLPRQGFKVVFGYRNGFDELEEMNTKGFNPTRTTWKAIRSIDGDIDIKLSRLMEWPLADHIALRKAITEAHCGYDTRVRFAHKCGKSMVVNLIADPSFLTPGLSW